MSGALTRAELHEEFTQFLNSELRQVFEEVLRTHLHHELSQYFTANGSDTKYGKARPSALSSHQSPPASPDQNSPQISPRIRIDNRVHTHELPETAAAAEGVEGHLEGPLVEKEGSYTLLPIEESEYGEGRPSSNRLRRNSHVEEVGALIRVHSEFHIDLSCKYLSLVAGVAVLLNAACVGWETNHRLLHHGHFPPSTELIERVFCIFFVTEISIRIQGKCSSFFCGDERLWNLFDLSIVIMQLVEQFLLLLCSYSNEMGSLPTLRMLRLLRMVRVLRLVRTVRLFEELSLIVASLMKTIWVLLWFVILLILLVYMFGILLLQMILDVGKLQYDDQVFQHWFGTVPRTMFTMFESITGGVSWDEVATHLMSITSPWAGFLFSLYILVAMLAVLNMLTGLFVDRSMKLVKEDSDFHMAAKIHNLFLKNENDIFEIDWPTFAERVQSDVMLEYMGELGIHPDEAEDLFMLLDDDQSGYINSSEIVDGCLRLRGYAKSLDIALLIREIRSLRSSIINRAPAAASNTRSKHPQHRSIWI